MSPDQLAQQLAAAGCVMTSAGAIAVDSALLMRTFIAKLSTIERLEAALAAESERCACICDEVHKKDDRDNGAAATGAAEIAAEVIRGRRKVDDL